MSRLPTPSRLRQLLRYDPETGKLYWRKRTPDQFKDGVQKTAECLCQGWNKKHAGREAFVTRNSGGYLYGRVDRVRIAAHRAVFAIVNGRWPTFGVDHINGDTADNRYENLREASHSVNGKNCKRWSTNKSGVTGVRPAGRKFAAEIHSAGRRINLGRFTTLREAASARKAAERELGFHENHGR